MMKTLRFTVTLQIEVEQRAYPGPDAELTAEAIRQHFDRDEEINLSRRSYNFGDAQIVNAQVEPAP